MSDGCVGVCTLTNVVLPTALSHHPVVVHAAPVLTENLGVEKLIETVIQAPAIRFLLICGQESNKQVGQALLALAEFGVNRRGRILNAKGPYPFLRNLSEDQVRRYRDQVEVIDRVGVEDEVALMALLDDLRARDPGPYAGPAAVASLEPMRAHHDPLKEWYPDDTFFLIKPNRETGEIVLEHYTMSMERLHILIGRQAEELTHTIVREGWIRELTHAAYLGRELAKAEAALHIGLAYIQDDPLARSGEDPTVAPGTQRPPG